jgi:hypothetical protein
VFLFQKGTINKREAAKKQKKNNKSASRQEKWLAKFITNLTL